MKTYERIELPGGYYISLEGDYAYLKKSPVGFVATLEKYGTQNGHKTARDFAAAMHSQPARVDASPTPADEALAREMWKDGQIVFSAEADYERTVARIAQLIAAHVAAQAPSGFPKIDPCLDVEIMWEELEVIALRYGRGEISSQESKRLAHSMLTAWLNTAETYGRTDPEVRRKTLEEAAMCPVKEPESTVEQTEGKFAYANGWNDHLNAKVRGMVEAVQRFVTIMDEFDGGLGILPTENYNAKVAEIKNAYTALKSALASSRHAMGGVKA